ncbi:hypothetical protein E7T09_17190 [Deinococcus sp. KSM4-11]|uniref:phosphotransferase n=1 Tax=Deinococcus sp. KSM4-11 TaxID=2568654 RepID=UPI0010A3FC67|nr:phosphotransferase [Deinococcus sp. KSM4-11]THF85232.1 hypothetical protein E7T09_17190 [Deinococcus sp. KSM4-11]
MSTPLRETTLHLLFTRRAQAALHTLTTDHTTYFGANVTEVAVGAGLAGWPLRRLHFKTLGEEGGVRQTESVWHLDAWPGTVPDWQPGAELPQHAQPWLQTARAPLRSVPWMQPGWFADALAWVDAELAAQDRPRTDEPVVLKHWQISALWRVPTGSGPVYFKAVPAFFRREVEVTPVLARDLPGAAPPVLAADTARGFLLLDDAGREVSEAPDLNALMTQVARLQRASSPLLSTLSLRTRGPEYVRSWLNRLLSEKVLLTGQEGGFTPDETLRLRALQPHLDATLTRLSEDPLPRTLGHGDLHGGNVTTRNGGFTLLDWSDVCATHPFLDVNPAYFFPWQVDPPPEALAAARDVYLQEWADLAPLDDLRSLYADALVCGELFRALGYVDGLQAEVEDKAEWSTAHLDHLRRVLRLSEGQGWTWVP